MSEPTNHEVVLWLQSRFVDFKQRGLVTRSQADAYNRAHPERPYMGPVRDTSKWSRGNDMAIPKRNAAQLRYIPEPHEVDGAVEPIGPGGSM